MIFSDRDKKVGQLRCRICKTHFSSKINHLSHEVDVFCDWIDECHKLNDKQTNVDDDEQDDLEGEEDIENVI